MFNYTPAHKWGGGGLGVNECLTILQHTNEGGGVGVNECLTILQHTNEGGWGLE